MSYENVFVVVVSFASLCAVEEEGQEKILTCKTILPGVVGHPRLPFF